MLSTNLIIATCLIAILSPLCLANNSEMQPFLNKPYHLVSSDNNFDKVLQKLGIGSKLRMDFELAKPTLTLEWEAKTNTYTLSEQSSLGKYDVSFQVGKGFIEKTIDGRMVHAIFTLHGTTLRETQKQYGKHELVVERTFGTDQVLINLQIDGIKSNRVYDAVKNRINSCKQIV